MIANILALINKHATGIKVLVWFLITQVIYLTMLLVTIPKVLTHAGEMKLLDMMPTGYDVDYVKMLFENLGQAGREAYLYRQIPLDLIYPLLFSISFSLLLALILKTITKEGSMVFYLCFSRSLPDFLIIWKISESSEFWSHTLTFRYLGPK